MDLDISNSDVAQPLKQSETELFADLNSTYQTVLRKTKKKSYNFSFRFLGNINPIEEFEEQRHKIVYSNQWNKHEFETLCRKHKS